MVNHRGIKSLIRKRNELVRLEREQIEDRPWMLTSTSRSLFPASAPTVIGSRPAD
jgi:hypothetical protein